MEPPYTQQVCTMSAAFGLTSLLSRFLRMINAKYKPNEWLNHLHGERDPNYYSICAQDIRKFSCMLLACCDSIAVTHYFTVVRMSTGLLILSKYPIVNATMWQYMVHSIGSDFFAQKGIRMYLPPIIFIDYILQYMLS